MCISCYGAIRANDPSHSLTLTIVARTQKLRFHQIFKQ